MKRKLDRRLNVGRVSRFLFVSFTSVVLEGQFGFGVMLVFIHGLGRVEMMSSLSCLFGQKGLNELYRLNFVVGGSLQDRPCRCSVAPPALDEAVL